MLQYYYMLTVICGEDNSASRKYYCDLQEEFRQQKKEIIIFKAKDIHNLSLWLGEALSLFATEKVFFTENLDKLINRRDKKNLEQISVLIKDKDLKIYDWEEKAQWVLKLKTLAQIKEFKLSATIFKLLDNFHPQNKKVFKSLLLSLMETTDVSFIYAMLVKQVRNLILIKTNNPLEKVTPWQQTRLKSIARLWSLDKLLQAYANFHKIDIGIKTSSTPFSVMQSLDIITCYFL